MDFLPGIEGLEGEEGVPMDLKNSPVAEPAVEGVAESGMSEILVAESKRRCRRMSSSICCKVRRRSLNFSALALFQREKRSSVGGRWCWGGEGFRCGAKMGNGMGSFSAIFGKRERSSRERHLERRVAVWARRATQRR